MKFFQPMKIVRETRKSNLEYLSFAGERFDEMSYKRDRFTIRSILGIHLS